MLLVIESEQCNFYRENLFQYLFAMDVFVLISSAVENKSSVFVGLIFYENAE